MATRCTVGDKAIFRFYLTAAHFCWPEKFYSVRWDSKTLSTHDHSLFGEFHTISWDRQRFLVQRSLDTPLNVPVLCLLGAVLRVNTLPNSAENGAPLSDNNACFTHAFCCCTKSAQKSCGKAHAVRPQPASLRALFTFCD